ncbi:MAG: winged helix-turn-helix domain-containing protein [Acidobacteriota bacterium]
MTYQFGTYQFDDISGVLTRAGEPVRLEPQPAKALAILLLRAGNLVSREAMRQHLWGADTHVDFDRGLAYCIGHLRAVLGDSGENPRFVQTIPRKGFRFIAPVARVVGPDGSGEIEGATAAPAATSLAAPGVPDARAGKTSSAVLWAAASAIVLLTGAGVWAAWTRLAAERPLVAVTVFDNETGLAEYDRLAAGAADVMVDALTSLGPDRLGVIGNAVSVRQPRDLRDPEAIRRETSAHYMVIGQVQRDDQGIRMVTHLIRLDDATHLWVTRVVRPMNDLAGIEAVSAQRLTDAVRLHVIERRADAPRVTR